MSGVSIISGLLIRSAGRPPALSAMTTCPAWRPTPPGSLVHTKNSARTLCETTGWGVPARVPSGGGGCHVTGELCHVTSPHSLGGWPRGSTAGGMLDRTRGITISRKGGWGVFPSCAQPRSG
eukprot:COSAG01_NODE_601_length_14954_cov_175.954359_5_plen_122_part_00